MFIIVLNVTLRRCHIHNSFELAFVKTYTWREQIKIVDSKVENKHRMCW